MTAGADAMNSPLYAALSHQAGPRQDSLRDELRDLGSSQYPLKLVSLSARQSSNAVRWRTVANSSSGTRTLSAAYHTGDSIYERIKSILLERPWPPGQLVQIGMLARELGTSTTPVREALVRLAAERLIAYAPKKGFLVKTITEEELRGLYVVNQMYLQTALSYSRERLETVLKADIGGCDAVHVEPCDSSTGSAITTERLFLRIAASAGIQEIVATVGNVNDRLRRPRMAEYAVIDGWLPEVSVIADLFFASGEYEKLHRAIRHYHEVRLRMLPSICKELLSISFAGR